MRRISKFQFPISQRPLIALLFCLTSVPALNAAEDVPTITVSKGDRINFAVSPLSGSDGATSTKVLQNDLSLSGYFILGGANSSYTVRGTADGGNLQGQVVDHSGGAILPKSYNAGVRDQAHQLANHIIEKLTRNKGKTASKITFYTT